MLEKETPKKITTKEEKKEEKKITEKSKKLISFDEFFTSYPLRREYKARIKMELGDDLFKTKEEWLEIVGKFDEEI